MNLDATEATAVRVAIRTLAHTQAGVLTYEYLLIKFDFAVAAAAAAVSSSSSALLFSPSQEKFIILCSLSAAQLDALQEAHSLLFPSYFFFFFFFSFRFRFRFIRR